MSRAAQRSFRGAPWDCSLASAYLLNRDLIEFKDTVRVTRHADASGLRAVA